MRSDRPRPGSGVEDSRHGTIRRGEPLSAGGLGDFGTGISKPSRGVRGENPDLDPRSALHPAAGIAVGGSAQSGPHEARGEFVQDESDGLGTTLEDRPHRVDQPSPGVREGLALRRNEVGRIVLPLAGSSFEAISEFQER